MFTVSNGSEVGDGDGRIGRRMGLDDGGNTKAINISWRIGAGAPIFFGLLFAVVN